MGDGSYLANGVAHSAITMFAEKLRIGTVIIVKKKKIRVVLFENMWVENWQFRWDFRDIMRFFFSFLKLSFVTIFPFLFRCKNMYDHR